MSSQDTSKKGGSGIVKKNFSVHLLHDFMSMKPEDYEELFNNLDVVISFNGHHWRHNSKSNFFSTSYKFDKYAHEVCFSAISKLKPKTSVVARKNTRQLVEPHCINKFILKLDIKKYYESIDFADVEDSLKKSGVDIELCGYINQFYFSDGKSLRRGLRASSILSEYVGLKIDNLVSKSLHELGYKKIPYTRFYDDMLFSDNDKEVLRKIEAKSTAELASIGLEINKRKTRIQPTHTANILGLRIHNGNLVVPKAFKKKLRARINAFEKYMYMLYKTGYWEDSDAVYMAKVKVGTVIGSHWYIINNSSSDVKRYSRQLEHYYEVLAECSRQLNYLLGHADIVEYTD